MCPGGRIRLQCLQKIDEGGDRNRSATRVSRKRLTPRLSAVSLPLGHAVYESGDRLSHIYLPTTAVVSTLHVMENGTSAEIAVARRDGLTGVTMFMGGETRPGRAIVQSGGEAYKLGTDVMRQESARGSAVRQLLLRYTQTLITPIARTAACTRHHSIAQQFCRWLLLTLDGVEPNEIRMTQELIANMPGVRHAGVAEAAARLPNEAVIRHRYRHHRGIRQGCTRKPRPRAFQRGQTGMRPSV
jgi:CRP-like cAMP-binding protein